MNDNQMIEAEEFLRKSIEMRQKVLIKDHPDIAESMEALGNVLYNQ